MRFVNALNRCGRSGVSALSDATPKDTGITASSWDYRLLSKGRGKYAIEWFNTNINKGVVIAILIQYGHGTGKGGYVQPTDYVNPAMRPVFDNLADTVWKEVTNL